MQEKKADYVLACPLCGARYEDSPGEFMLSCPAPHPPALLRAIYRIKRFVAHPEQTGVFRFFDWLPIRRKLPGAAGPVAFHSTALGPALGLENLFVIFNGWWPEKGALMQTCTFKELEAQAVCGRIVDDWRSSLVVSSAGNTARAFHDACSRYNVPALIVVPADSMPLLWSTGESHREVQLAVLDGGADYADAIELGNTIAATEGFYSEGGARNAARRDGMGTTVLSAVEASGRIPDHYFQAVGSGTGAIAAWEMSLRLREDGRFGSGRMKLHLSQNAPFTPMTDAWEAGSRTLAALPDGRRLSRCIRARVLGNRNPPYSIAGGLYDALSDTGGFMYRVADREARAAGRLFEKLEGCDIDPAAEVALASLQQAVEQGRIGRRDMVALNITGGGYCRLRRERRVAFLRPQATFTLEALRKEGPARGLALLRGGRA
ncbi:MAG: cysteate synthase [Spirochaetia bacterium]|jgi:cysteate synthase